jgi:hypothetical protein
VQEALAVAARQLVSSLLASDHATKVQDLTTVISALLETK